MDVDLDHELAVALAPKYLPETGAIFGRRGKPRSHYLYVVTEPAATQQWRLPNRKIGRRTAIDGGSNGFPRIDPSQWRSDRMGCGRRARHRRTDRVTLAHHRGLYDSVCRQLNVSKRPETGRPASTITAPRSVLDRARSYLSKLPPAISQQGGHAATFKAACRLVIGFGLDGEQALTLLRAWNESCQPPWTEKELAHKVDDALRQPGWRGYLLAGRQREVPASSAIERANRHAIEHRRRARRRAHA